MFKIIIKTYNRTLSEVFIAEHRHLLVYDFEASNCKFVKNWFFAAQLDYRKWDFHNMEMNGRLDQ